MGYRIPFSSPHSLSPVPIPTFSLSGSHPHAQLFPFLHQGKSVSGGSSVAPSEGAIELAPPSPGYYSRLFVVWRTSGSWRPVIDLSHLSRLVTQTLFKMETNQFQLVLRAIRRYDWMVSIDLKDAYLQIAVHPDSHQLLRFVAFGVSYQFKVLCFGLSMAPQVFTWVMAPASALLHRQRIRMLWYLDDWLVLVSSRTDALWVRDEVLSVETLEL